MSRFLAVSVAVTVAVFPLGCKAFQDALLAHMLRNQARLQSYQGVLVETGLTPEGALQSEIAFERPDRVLIRANAPDAYRGATVLAADGAVTLYWPQLNYAVRVDHLPRIDATGQRKLLTDTYWHGVATFDGEIGEMSHIAGHPTVRVKYRAKRADAPDWKNSFSVYDRFSIPLAGEMHFSGGVDYGFRYEKIDFNQPIDDATFHLELPPTTVVTHWDLDGPDVPLPKAKAHANFPLLVPESPPANLVQTRLVQADGLMPAYTVVYRSDPYYALLTEYKDLDLKLPGIEVGLPVTAGHHQGKLLIAPFSTTYTFREGGVVYQVYGNLPLEDVLAFASRL